MEQQAIGWPRGDRSHTCSSAVRRASCPGEAHGFKALENDVLILTALTDIETDRHRGAAYVGM